MEMSGKSEVREWVKENRLALTQKQEMEWNDAICKKILSLRTIRQAFCVYCYVSFRHEAGTEKLITSLLEMGKYVAVPKVEGKRLVFYAIQGKRDLESGVMGIISRVFGVIANSVGVGGIPAFLSMRGDKMLIYIVCIVIDIVLAFLFTVLLSKTKLKDYGNK